jgi:hypothetical protein
MELDDSASGATKLQLASLEVISLEQRSHRWAPVQVRVWRAVVPDSSRVVRELDGLRPKVDAVDEDLHFNGSPLFNHVRCAGLPSIGVAFTRPGLGRPVASFRLRKAGAC